MIQYIDQQLIVPKTIDFENAEQVYQSGLVHIQQHKHFPLVVDLTQLEQGSTLSLAVLVQWLRQTPESKGLHFKNVPEKMLKIIQACHLEDDLILL
ncbi:STAS domain-containing protein [Acinetobacter halotolerans]|uniref:STAS domain-containing protein n=1 Tax=Acinetobacter halotolerans TaxID=1752076 RepID=A0A4Q6XD16_9GAMM|nr:STAS domain-containing protein [Acinetobacter halotolerans]RZF56999.1 STAS domain-containing protein [Acinetobacter halotolerans]